MSQYLHIPKTSIDLVLSSVPVDGKHVLEGIKKLIPAGVGFPFTIIEDVHYSEIKAEMHHHEADIFYCLDGKATFVCGGELIDIKTKQNADGTINPNEVRGTGIKNGTEIIFETGDWLWIPPGLPHYHFAKYARMVVIKVAKSII